MVLREKDSQGMGQDIKEFYKPGGNGYEAKIREHMKRIKTQGAAGSGSPAN